MNPRTENITKPAKTLVPQFIKATIRESLSEEKMVLVYGIVISMCDLNCIKYM